MNKKTFSHKIYNFLPVGLALLLRPRPHPRLRFSWLATLMLWVSLPAAVHAQAPAPAPAQAVQGAATAETAELGGLKIDTSLTAVYQAINSAASAGAQAQRRINYRGDVFLTLPAGAIGSAIGSASGTAVAQLRMGVGSGLTLLPTYSATTNSTGFAQDAGANSYYATLAQAYYQLVLPLEADQKGASSRLELTAGKLDLFAFFDQNAVSGDESRAFLNNAFVHNPLLDSGADTGADKYGFAPGARLGFYSAAGAFDYGLSIGVFGAGPAADFSARPRQPLVVAQFELSPLSAAADQAAAAHYRIYAWTNGQTRDFDLQRARHSGWGVSLDQKLGQNWRLASRYGQRTNGSGRFDQAFTLAAELTGSNWGRGADVLGLASGWLKTGSGYQLASQDGTLLGYASSGNERLLEIYYRYQLSDKLALSPDFQLITRPGGDGHAARVRVAGVRASLGF